MDNLEQVVEPLRDLPDRMTKVEAEIVQLRTEMRVVERLKILGEGLSRQTKRSRNSR